MGRQCFGTENDLSFVGDTFVETAILELFAYQNIVDNGAEAARRQDGVIQRNAEGGGPRGRGILRSCLHHIHGR